MAAEAHPQRAEAISVIRSMRAFYSQDPAEGERQAYAKFPDIAKATWSGWVKLARQPAEPASVRPTSVRASTMPAADGKPLTFEQRIARIDSHVAMIVTASTREVIDESSGEIRTLAKNPAMLAQAVRLQSGAAEMLVKYAIAVENLGRMQELYDTIIEEIGKVSPEVQRAVFDRLREVNEQRGNARFGIGVVPEPAHALPDVDF